MGEDLKPYAYGAAWFNRRGQRVSALARDAVRFRRYALYDTPEGALLLYEDDPLNEAGKRDDGL